MQSLPKIPPTVSGNFTLQPPRGATPSWKERVIKAVDDVARGYAVEEYYIETTATGRLLLIVETDARHPINPKTMAQDIGREAVRRTPAVQFGGAA